MALPLLRSTTLLASVLLLLLLSGGAKAQTANFNQTFETLATGLTDIPYFTEQNCKVAPCDRCETDPVYVTTEQARVGVKSLRMNRRFKDAALTGGSYCGYRNEIGNYNDAFADYNEHTWIGFSVYIANNILGDRYGADNVHIFQFKNVDAGGGGNQFGSIITHNTSTGNYYDVAGLGDVLQTKLNTWVDIQLHLYYKTDGTGIIEVWIDNTYAKKTNVTFPAKQSCYPKFGTYSADMAATDPAHQVYYDEIKWYTAPDGGNYRNVIRPNKNSSKDSDVARGKPVSAPGSQAGYGGEKLVDGYTNAESRWSAQGYPKTAVIDLGSEFLVNTAEVFPYENRAYQYSVDVSLDNANWVTVMNRTTNTETGAALNKNFPERSARYVRLRVTGASGYTGDWVSIRELRMYGRPSGVSALQQPNAPILGAKGKDGALRLDIHPNPVVDGTIFLDILDPAVPALSSSTLEVYSLTGQLLYRTRVQEAWVGRRLPYPFDVPGVYLVRLWSGEAEVIRQVVVP